MLRSTARIRITFALVSAAGLALPALGGGVAAAASARPQAAAVTWSRVTPAGTNIIDDIGLARGTDGTTTVWKVYLNAQATKVDVLVLATQHGNNKDAAYWDAQVPQP